MSLLSIVQDALRDIGDFEIPSSVVGNRNLTAVQSLRLANAEGRSLAAKHNWSVLRVTTTITTVANDADYALPADFDRFEDNTWWDETNSWMLIGPVTPQNWQALKSGIIADGVRRYFRISGGEFVVHPTPTVNGDTLVYQYISRNWCASSGGTGQSEFLADADVGILDEELLKRGLMWRFLKARGKPYAEEYEDYRDLRDKAIARDGGSAILRMDSAGIRENSLLLNIPDTGYGS